MTDDILVFLEHDGGEVANVSYEILGKARDLAGAGEGDVAAVVAGAPEAVEGLADATIAHGADTVHLVADDLLSPYRPETFATAVERVVDEVDPRALLVPATHNGVDLAGRLAVRLDTGLNADVVRLEIDDGGDLVGGVPAFAGGILAMVKALGRPQMSTVRPGVFAALEPDESRGGSVETHDVDLDEDDVITEIHDREIGETVDLPSADVVVCAGRGFDGDLDLAEDLVDSLDATLGVTRPLADEGLVSRDRQVGSTGYSLQAEVAIVAGISGSVYFTAGLEDVDTVVAINVDGDEPIFDEADYCVEGDLFEVLPALLDELEAQGVVA